MSSRYQAQRTGLVAVALFVAAVGTCHADPIQTYIALGDALAFGQSTSTPQASYGNQGYVQQFANYLGSLDNGIAPNVINLAIPGETSASYFSADNSTAARQAGAQANLNYGGDSTLAQRNFLAGVAAAEHAAGRTVSTVSFALGLGDFQALSNTPAFQNATIAQQEAMVDQLIATLKSNYTTALSQIRGVLPNASLYLPSYYNPYGYLSPTDPQNVLTGYFVGSQLQLIQSLSQQFNANVVNLEAAFAGHELQLTNVASGNIYPNAQGYSAIANQVISVAETPEPGSMALMAIGAAAVAGWSRVRRRPV
jgi:lysophospholipase L1-like esterase